MAIARRRGIDGWRPGPALGVIVLALGACFAACSDPDTGIRASGGGAAGSGGAAGAMPPTSGTGGGGPIIGGGPSDSGVMGCAVASVKSEFVPANILVVLDRSGSMNCNLPPITDSAACEKNPVQADATQPTKWTVVKKALKDAVAALLGTASVGLSYFNTDDECGANSLPSVGVKLLASGQIDALAANLDGAKAPQGGTPIVGATILAYKHLHQQAQVTGNKFVLLITDGAETCDADKISQLGAEIPKAMSVNIRTFVIGAPGSEGARGMLSEMAFMGGTAQSPSCQMAGSMQRVAIAIST
jgi:hypothetical protein